MRRVHLRRCANIAKRYLVHVAAGNLGLLMRTLFGNGTPRGMRGRAEALQVLAAACQRIAAVTRAFVSHLADRAAPFLQPASVPVAA
jgi:hypothetical protein